MQYDCSLYIFNKENCRLYYLLPQKRQKGAVWTLTVRLHNTATYKRTLASCEAILKLKNEIKQLCKLHYSYTNARSFQLWYRRMSRQYVRMATLAYLWMGGYYGTSTVWRREAVVAIILEQNNVKTRPKQGGIGAKTMLKRTKQG